jgi:hypothetical protein
MGSRIPGFPGEYLWELDIAKSQLLALAAAVPDTLYGWSPAEGARTFSAVLVHIAAVNLALLGLIDQPVSEDQLARIREGVRENLAMERTVTDKAQVGDLLCRSFGDLAQRFAATADLDKPGVFFGERTTARRVYLRALAHAHEHMGQAIAYARCNGIRVPWPDPVKQLGL